MKPTKRAKHVTTSPAEKAEDQVEQEAVDQTGQKVDSKEKDPLTETEKRLLDQFEKSIESGLKSFVDVGVALTAIRDQKLYRDGFKTFEDYCQERWHMGRQYAYRLIQAAECSAVLMKESSLKGKQLPINESQVRPLTQLVASKMVKAWEQVLDKTAGKRVTAEAVQDVVDKMVPNGNRAKTGKSNSNPKQKLEKIAKLITTTLEETSELTVPQLKQLLEKIQSVIEGKKKKTA